MNLVVGCPIYKREWIVPAWLDHLWEASSFAKVTPSLVFVGDRSDPTFDLIEEYSPFEHTVVEVEQPKVERGEHCWSVSAYEFMVELRNALLGQVREIEPELFLSLDSDILLHPAALRRLIDTLDEHPEWGAVGGKAFMQASSVACPSYAMLSDSGALRRPNAEGVFRVDVIMAIKLMTPAAYNVDYEVHWHGEDIGWSIAARRAGVVLGWSGWPTSKHVMSPNALSIVDSRCGF